MAVRKAATEPFRVRCRLHVSGGSGWTPLVEALIHTPGRRVSDGETVSVLEHAAQVPAPRANAIWAQHRRAPATVSLRDYLAMTLRFIDQAPTP